MLANKNLEIKEYNESEEEVTWATCTLRTWLNDTGEEESFINTAFTADEQAAIKTTIVANNDNPEYGTSGGAATKDKVYLLSIEEAKKTEYGFISTNDGTNTRTVEDTAYVKKQNSGEGSYGMWWLRSPGNWDNNAANVSSGGWVNWFGSNVNFVLPGVRL